MEFASCMDGSGAEICFLQEELSVTKVGASMESASCPDFQLSGSTERMDTAWFNAELKQTEFLLEPILFAWKILFHG